MAKFEFIKDLVAEGSLKSITKLDEGRMIRSKQKLKNMSVRDIADLFYLHIVALEILKHQYETAPTAMKYAMDTKRFQNFDRFHFNGTDLYMFAWALISDEGNDMFKKDKDKVLLNRININDRELKHYLQRIAYNRLEFERDRRWTLTLSYNLQISSIYRSLRRMAIEWPKLSRTQKQLLVTRLLQAFRSKAVASDLYPLLKQFADAQRLELKNVHNAETGKDEGSDAKKREWMKKVATGAAAAAGAYAGWKVAKMGKK